MSNFIGWDFTIDDDVLDFRNVFRDYGFFPDGEAFADTIKTLMGIANFLKTTPEALAKYFSLFNDKSMLDRLTEINLKYPLIFTAIGLGDMFRFIDIPFAKVPYINITDIKMEEARKSDGDNDIKFIVTYGIPKTENKRTTDGTNFTALDNGVPMGSIVYMDESIDNISSAMNGFTDALRDRSAGMDVGITEDDVDKALDFLDKDSEGKNADLEFVDKRELPFNKLNKNVESATPNEMNQAAIQRRKKRIQCLRESISQQVAGKDKPIWLSKQQRAEYVKKIKTKRKEKCMLETQARDLTRRRVMK